MRPYQNRYSDADVLTAVNTCTSKEPSLRSAIKTLLSEPAERRAPILSASAHLANGEIRSLGPLLAFEIIAAIGIMMAREEQPA